MTNEEFKPIIRQILASYPTQHQKMSAADMRNMAEAYFEGLEDLEAGRTRAAVGRLIRSSKWIPTIADIREAALENDHGQRRPGGDAWGDVKRAVSRFGYDRTPAFEDPIVARVVEALGWRTICNSDETDPSTRARFIEAYDALARAQRKEGQAATGAPLPQLAPRSNGTASVAGLLSQMLPKDTAK